MFPISDSIKINRFPFLNIGLIAVTLYIFVQQLMTPLPDLFIQKYALIPALVKISDPFTFVPFFTAIFLHGGFLHIISNM